MPAAVLVANLSDKNAAPLSSAYQLADVELLNESEGYQGFFQIRSLTLRHRLFAGSMSEPINRELFVRHDAVGVLLFDPALEAICLVEQFRVGAYGHQLQRQQGGPTPTGDDATAPSSPWLLELVAGLIDKDEPPATVAEREAVEEAGAIVQALEPIAEYYSSPGGSSEYFYLLCGKADLSAVGGIHGLAEESEDIRAHVISCDQAWQLLDQHRINNAHTLIALQWLQRHVDRVKKQWL